jgi:hypothetical protein
MKYLPFKYNILIYFFVTFQVSYIEEQYDKKNIRRNILDPIVNYENGITSVYSNVLGNSFTLTRRLTAKDLINSYVTALKRAQDAYIKEVEESHRYLLCNLQTCEKMDSVFGCDESTEEFNGDESTIEEQDAEQQKDGSYRVNCPVEKCKTRTYKIKRHLADIHLYSTDEQEYGTKMAKKIERNRRACEDKDDKKKDILTKTKPRKYQNTGLINRKNNYKQCMLCEGLSMNLPDHMKKVHSMPLSDPRYEKCIKEPGVIPKCYTKRIGSKAVLLCGVELEAAKAVYDKDIRMQTTILDDLKGYQQKITTVKKSIENASTESEHKQLQKSLQTILDDYKLVRYQDTRQYSPQMKSWKIGFLNYLTSRKESDPMRAFRMAADVMLPFESTQENKLNFADLMNGVTVRKMLTTFTNQENTSATTKLKYLAMFDLLMKYLVYNASSPERSANETNEETLSRGIKLKEVLHEIDTTKSFLSKFRGSDLIQTRRKAKGKLVTKEELETLLDETDDYLLKVRRRIK